jgi:hypothetical protein
MADMKIDRDSQRKILEELKAAYPQRLDLRGLEVGLEAADLAANLAYLEEHRLVDAKWGGNFAVANAKITARGIDFLADDGGLSAILGVLTVQLHEKTLKALLEATVDASTEPDSVKSTLKAQIRALPAEALKTITTELLKSSLTHLPNATHWLQSLLGP